MVPTANHAKDLADEIEKSKLKIQVVTEKMPMSVDDFEKKFVLENAPHGWLRYRTVYSCTIFLKG